MEKNETLLTIVLYEAIIEDLVKNIVELKKQQGISINKIDIEKDVLKKLKIKLKALRKDIRISRCNLFQEQRNLRRINKELNVKNNRVLELNDSFTKEEETYIDLNNFSSEEVTKKR